MSPRDLDETLDRPPSGEDADLPPSLSGLQIGEVLDDKYTIIRLLGRGAMGDVYEGVHVLLHRRVAIKIMRRGAADPEWEHQFLTEGRHLARIIHPGVVEIFDLGKARGLYYIVMAYLEGETLADRLVREGRLPIADVCAVGHQLLAGLAATHEHGIVHRDIKPENIFLARTAGGAAQAKLVDFGISTTTAAAQAGEVAAAGTPGYMAPEQVMGGAVDERTDLYGFGATLYEAITGRPLFDGKDPLDIIGKVCREAPVPPRVLRPDLPPELEAVLLRALSKRPSDRYQTAREMLAACGFVTASRATPDEERPALIAEADPVAAARYQTILAKLGRISIVARDGAEALELLRGPSRPALLLANLSLPRLDGFALLKEARKTLSPHSLPALAVSGAPALREAAWTRREALGISQVLPTQIGADALRDALSAALSGKRIAGERPSTPGDRQGAELQRLQRIAAMRLVDDLPPPDALQHLVADLAHALDVPIALVSLVLKERQWFKAHFGLQGAILEERGTPRDWAFCDHVVAEGEPLVVPDAREHPVFGDNPLVQGGAVCGYAGAPVMASGGEVLGTLCVIDNKPLNLGADVIEALCALARRVGGELEVQSGRAQISRLPEPPPAMASSPPAAASPSGAPGIGAPPFSSGVPRPSAPRIAELPSLMEADEGSEMRLQELLKDPTCGILLSDESRRVIHASEGLCRMWELPLARIAGRTRDQFIEGLASKFEDPSVFRREMAVLPKGPFVAFAVVPMPGGRRLRWQARPLVVPQGVWHMETFRIEG